MKKLLLLLTILLITTSLSAKSKGFRKYAHVKSFYKSITMQTITIAKQNDLPAAAILAIAGLESGYGSGYVAQITGNILSLGAFKSDRELPPLYLPYSTSKKRILFDPKVIISFPRSDLHYKLRAKSYKRDYRPLEYAGSTKNLEYLKYNEASRKAAHKACLNDFATRWITLDSNIKAFRDAKIYLNKQLEEHGEKILFSMNINKGFIEKIGGVPNSFNYRKTWPKKVELIMHKTALVELVDDIVNKNMSFDEAWGN